MAMVLVEVSFRTRVEEFAADVQPGVRESLLKFPTISGIIP